MASMADVTGFMDWMNRNWQQSFAPIQDYSSFLLQLAVQKRQREMQLQDEARRTAERRAEAETERAFTRERDMARELATTTRDLYLNRQQEQAEIDRRAFQKSLSDTAYERAKEEQERLWKHQTDKEKDTTILELEAVASELGQPLPDKKLDRDTRFQQLNAIVGRNRSESVVNLNKRIAQTESQISQVTQSTEQERDNLAYLNLARDTMAIAGLTPDEKAKLLRGDDPELKLNIVKRLQADTSKKGKANLDAFVTGYATAAASAQEEYLRKSTATKNVIDALRSQAQTDRMMMMEVLTGKTTRIPASSFIASTEGMLDAVKEQQQQQTQARPDRSQILQGMGAGGGTAVRPPAAVAPPGQWPGVVPLVQQAAGGMSPGQIALSPGQAALRVSTGAAPAIQEIAQAIASDPGVQGLGRIAASPFRATRYALYGGEPPVWPTPQDLAINLSIRSPSEAVRQILDRITQARMRTTTADQQAAQNAIAPTAFPALPPVFSGAP